MPRTDSTQGAHRWKPINSISGFSMTDIGWVEDSNDLDNGEWAVNFVDGTVKGMSLCSSTSYQDIGEIGIPNEIETGRYCWCKATQFIPDIYDVISGDAHLIGCKSTWSTSCMSVIMEITGKNSTEAKNMLKAASSSTPQLIKNNATEYEIERLVQAGCEISEAPSHKGIMCYVNSSWVSGVDGGADDADQCEEYCAYDCSTNLNRKSGIEFFNMLFNITE